MSGVRLTSMDEGGRVILSTSTGYLFRLDSVGYWAV